MSIEGKIKTLFSDQEKTKALFPRTKVSAVSDDDGTGLNVLLENINDKADSKLPLSGGTMTGNITFSSSAGTGIITEIPSSITGGWSRGWDWKTTGGISGIGCLGADANFTYMYVGGNWGAPWMKVQPNGNVTATKFIGALQGNADTATKAIQDGNGHTITISYAHRQGISANGGFPSGSTAYGMLLSANPHVNGSTTGNDNYYLLVDSVRKFWVGTKLNAETTPSWVQMASVAYVSDNYATKTEMDKCYNSTVSRTANTVLAAPNGQNGVASFRKLVLAELPSGIKAATLAGDYTGNGGQQPPSYVVTSAVRCNMMSGFVGTTTTSFSSYADVLMMNAYNWSDVPYATALAIQKTSGVPRAWIAAGGNTSAWGGATELITSNNIGSQSVNYATSAGSASSATTASKLGTSTVGGTYKPIYLSNGTATACSLPITGGGGASSVILNYSGNTASGDYSHAEGYNTTASGYASHAGGYNTTALAYQQAQGHYNNTSTAVAGSSSGTGSGTAFVIGNGTSSSASNAFRVTYGGKVYCDDSYMSNGADYAEYFEWLDGNPNNEDRRGYFVTLDGEMIRIAQPDDYVLGVVSALPSVIGNSDEDWRNRYIYDEFGNYIEEEFEYQEEVTDEETGETIAVTKTGTKWKENPDYDSSIPYIQRADRPEWDAIGMVGVLALRDDGTCQVNGFCKVAEGGIATASTTGYRVIKRVNDHIIKIIFK